MLELFKKNDTLFVKVLMQLRLPIKYQNKLFGKEEQTVLLLPEEVNFILVRNGNIRLWNGEKYVKLNLGQFYDIMQRKEYNVVDYVEPKVEVKQPEVKVEKKEEPKVEVKQPEVKVEKKEEPKEVKQPEVKVEEPKVEEVKKEEPKQNENKNQQPKNNNNNNKPRHNNNNNKQGGGK
jgi:hypothetical protein